MTRKHKRLLKKFKIQCLFTRQHMQKTYYNLGFVLSFRALSDQNLKKASYFREKEKKTKTNQPPQTCFLPDSLPFVQNNMQAEHLHGTLCQICKLNEQQTSQLLMHSQSPPPKIRSTQFQNMSLLRPILTMI